MDSEIKQRLESALRPVEKPPTIEEVPKHVSTRGVLRGSVDWVFQAWMLYVEYATQEIIKTFRLSEEERSQLLDFRDTLKRLLLEAWRQAKEKLTTLYKAVAEGTYKLEGNKLYAPDGTWMHVIGDSTPHIPIRGITAKTRFPDLLKLPRERLELLQLGWRASDEGRHKRQPYMGTTQPWQVFAWAAARYGELYTCVLSTNLTHEGISIEVYIKAKSWRQKWSKDEAISLVADYLRRGEWTPMLTMWLGDGKARWRNILQSKYELLVATKEPWRLGIRKGAYEALVATGREAFVKLREAAGVYGELLDLLKAHKWIYIKLATDDGFRAAAKQNKKSITVEGVVMYLRLVSGRGGSLLAEHYTRNLGKAFAVADKLKAAGFRPNVVKSGPNYVVYIATADLLRLAERDGEIRRAVALYLTEKAENGTPRQRELARKLLQRHPLFLSSQSPHRLLDIAMR
ncbi:hypothetical protein B7L68_05095 [Thermoproteus sp. CP80]|uniref:hypothetical protein n=1 Tax=Thermoproteus sp. CP80 TaxID=1650659 RepID=UPI0009BFFA10|nr:hypothetical protein [Thermoproteus sp. CP80]PLC64137.1 hypothetical protein B7L68_05095 [Thermoproteus sp. CP80]